MLRREEAQGHLTEFGTILAGSSWGSDLERIVVEKGKASGVQTIVFLDHWTDYRERFISGGHAVLPDEIWVSDEYAEKLVRAIFPFVNVRNVGNDYLEGAAAQVKARSLSAIPRAGAKRVLFVSEPLSVAAERKYGNSRHYGYTEHDALAALFTHARKNWAGQIESMKIRRHPSEAPGKFSAVADQAPFPVVECGDAPLVEDCAWADWIVGCQSMALVVGLLAGKQVFSAIPRGGLPCAIPLPGIVPLFQLPPYAEVRAPLQGTTS